MLKPPILCKATAAAGLQGIHTRSPHDSHCLPLSDIQVSISAAATEGLHDVIITRCVTLHQHSITAVLTVVHMDPMIISDVSLNSLDCVVCWISGSKMCFFFLLLSRHFEFVFVLFYQFTPDRQPAGQHVSHQSCTVHLNISSYTHLAAKLSGQNSENAGVCV